MHLYNFWEINLNIYIFVIITLKKEVIFMRKFIILMILVVLSSIVLADDWIEQESTADGYDLHAVEAISDTLVYAVGTPVYPSEGVIVRTINGNDWETVLETEGALY